MMTKWLALVLCTACAGEVSDEMDVGTVETPLPAAGLEGFEHRMTVKAGKLTSRCMLSVPNWNASSVDVLHQTNGILDYNATVLAPGAPYPKTVVLDPDLKVLFSCESGGNPPCRMEITTIARSRNVGDVLNCRIRSQSLVASSTAASANVVEAPKATFRQSLSMNAARTLQQHMCQVNATDTSVVSQQTRFLLFKNAGLVLDENQNDNGLLWKTEVPTAVGQRFAGQDGTDGQAQHVIPYAQGVIPGQLMSCRVPASITDAHEVAFNTASSAPDGSGGNVGISLAFQFATD